MFNFDSFEMFVVDFESFESAVYGLLENIEVDSGEYLSEVSLCLHEAIEDALEAYGRDNDIYDDYDPLY